MISAHSQADGPVYLTTAVEDTVQLYLAPIGEWGSEAKAVRSIKRYLRDEGFTIESVQRLSAQYGVYHIPCIQFRCSGRLDKQLKLTQAHVDKLRKIVRPSCTAMGNATATAIYLDGQHVNTKVTFTVFEGAVTRPEADRPYIPYEIHTEGDTYSFYLARPVGKEAEDPANAATTVARALGLYTPNRITPGAIGRHNVAVAGGHGDAALNYM